MKAIDIIKAVQTSIGVTPDGIWGPKSGAALDGLIASDLDAEWPPVPGSDEELHTVKATSFADPADVHAFQRCKATGKSDEECFRVGDNGVGKWGYDCTQGSGPSCALPPEEWQQFSEPRGKAVKIVNLANGKVVTAKLKDTMPHYKNITNGAGIDLSPDACAALGISIPADARVTWQWV